MESDSSPPGPSTLVVFCRRPVLGTGKQRIAASLGAVAALELAEHLLATALEDAVEWPGPVILAPASRADGDWAGRLLPGNSQVIPQPEGNLGTRINAVDEIARNAGHAHLIYIGSDAPVRKPDYFATARSALATHDVVLGSAADGGVTLMGAGVAWPDLAGLPWSTRALGESLELACVESGLTVYSLDQCYDIDVAADLPRLYDDLGADSRPARRRLHQWLATIVQTDIFSEK